MNDLTNQKCVPCEGGVEPINRADAQAMLEHHVPDWVLGYGDQSFSPEATSVPKNISKHFKFKNFSESLAFVNKIGELAEAEGHHPDIELRWGKVNVIPYNSCHWWAFAKRLRNGRENKYFVVFVF